ncbi:hypothetical protein XBI1_2660047 [Xenorhabdus bovienii str. Intermedium]|uniref:Uncharacterized protein n=1 Tax=Xenorhabdus bovienii str. Intermedium TaxID=1379677 RepID=A0A077QB99_XENBV|nr:hypothetical protein XBI1_2660047 [Xenorhabdus bovienii str. Intermedium]
MAFYIQHIMLAHITHANRGQNEGPYFRRWRYWCHQCVVFGTGRS